MFPRSSYGFSWNSFVSSSSIQLELEKEFYFPTEVEKWKNKHAAKKKI